MRTWKLLIDLGYDSVDVREWRSNAPEERVIREGTAWYRRLTGNPTAVVVQASTEDLDADAGEG